MIRLNLSVAITDSVDLKEHATNLKSTDFGEIIIESANERVVVTLEDMEEAVSTLREFNANNPRQERPSSAMLEEVVVDQPMQMVFGAEADRE